MCQSAAALQAKAQPALPEEVEFSTTQVLPQYVQDVSGRSLQYPVPPQLSNGGWREMQNIAQYFIRMLAQQGCG